MSHPTVPIVGTRLPRLWFYTVALLVIGIKIEIYGISVIIYFIEHDDASSIKKYNDLEQQLMEIRSLLCI